jgi:hypothetical protein
LSLFYCSLDGSSQAAPVHRTDALMKIQAARVK